MLSIQAVAVCWTKSSLLSSLSVRAHSVWAPCLMSIHANTFPPHNQRERQTERERGKRATLVTRNTSCSYISVMCTNTPRERLPLLIRAIPAANYIQRHPIITSSTSISTCCMNPSGLHNCRLSICLENTGYNVQGAARGREKQDSSRSPLLPFSTRWSNIHLPLALCWTFIFQTTTLLTLSNLHFHLNGRFKLVSSIFSSAHLLTTACYSAGKHQHVCEDGDRRQDCYSARRGCYLICNEFSGLFQSDHPI